MSAVLQQTKDLYKKVIFIEIIALVSFFLLFVFNGIAQAVSFFLGGLASFLPFCIFVYWIFFHKHQNQNKIGSFYRGEGLKWLATIILIVLSFKGYATLHIVSFFGGYFLFLVLNSILPIVLKRQIN